MNAQVIRAPACAACGRVSLDALRTYRAADPEGVPPEWVRVVVSRGGVSTDYYYVYCPHCAARVHSFNVVAP